MRVITQVEQGEEIDLPHNNKTNGIKDADT